MKRVHLEQIFVIIALFNVTTTSAGNVSVKRKLISFNVNWVTLEYVVLNDPMYYASVVLSVGASAFGFYVLSKKELDKLNRAVFGSLIEDEEIEIGKNPKLRSKIYLDLTNCMMQ